MPQAPPPPNTRRQDTHRLGSRLVGPSEPWPWPSRGTARACASAPHDHSPATEAEAKRGRPLCMVNASSQSIRMRAAGRERHPTQQVTHQSIVSAGADQWRTACWQRWPQRAVSLRMLYQRARASARGRNRVQRRTRRPTSCEQAEGRQQGGEARREAQPDALSLQFAITPSTSARHQTWNS